MTESPSRIPRSANQPLRISSAYSAGRPRPVRRLGLRHHVLDVDDPAVRRDEGDRQRDEGVLHPEGQALGLLEDEQHAVIGPQPEAVHQARRPLLGGRRDFGGQLVLADREGSQWQVGSGRDGAEGQGQGGEGNQQEAHRRNAGGRFVGRWGAAAFADRFIDPPSSAAVDGGAVECRREARDEVVDVAAQEGAAAQGEAGGGRREQVARVELRQPGIARRVVGHLRDDADAHAELDVGLDHVGVERGQHDVGRESLRRRTRR